MSLNWIHLFHGVPAYEYFYSKVAHVMELIINTVFDVDRFSVGSLKYDTDYN